jgi:hypothetical protein
MSRIFVLQTNCRMEEGSPTSVSVIEHSLWLHPFSNIFPNDFEEACLSPIHKWNSNLECGNYRPRLYKAYKKKHTRNNYAIL